MSNKTKAGEGKLLREVLLNQHGGNGESNQKIAKLVNKEVTVVNATNKIRYTPAFIFEVLIK